MSRIIGLSDVPETNGNFQIDDLIKNWTSYIVNCDTPMTVSLQGEWGSGKTSIMEAIKDELKNNDRVNILDFNVWEYSQFDLQGLLPIMLLDDFYSKVKQIIQNSDSDKDIENDRIFSGNFLITRAAEKATGIVTSLLTQNDIFTKKIGSVMRDFLNVYSAEETPMLPKMMLHYRTKLIDAMGKYLSQGRNSGMKRIIVFLDDLDRIEPKKAVELLDCIKNFMATKGCVFVVAVDYSTLSQAIKDKYGFIDKTKSKEYFDKIFQMTFEVPIEKYNIEGDNGFILEKLRSIPFLNEKINELQSDDSLSQNKLLIDNCKELVLYSSHRNPRSIKRICNNAMVIFETWKGDEPKDLILAAICMQCTYEDIFNQWKTLIKTLQVISTDKSQKLVLRNNIEQRLRNWANSTNQETMGERKMNDRIHFFKKILWMISDENAKAIDNNNLDAFIFILDFLSYTANKEESELSNSFGASLENAELSGLNLSDVDFSGMNIKKGNLCSSNLNRAMLIGTVLDEADCKGANMIGANMSGAFAQEADLSMSCFEHANLSKTNFHNADFVLSDMQYINARNSDFSGANLSSANLCAADCSRADFSDAILSNIRIDIKTVFCGSRIPHKYKDYISQVCRHTDEIIWV